MSYAIKSLGLGLPPIHVERLGNANVRVYRAVCDCGYLSQKYPLIGLAMEQMGAHGDLHRIQRQEAAA